MLTFLQYFRKEVDVFFAAVMFYTRIPCPKWVNYDPDYLNQATKYFPLIGWIVGGISAVVFGLSNMILPLSVSVILALIAGVLTTGAFHEDGFADACDGFGGGWTAERILEIMKDSRVGVYGSFGLLLLFFSKYLIIVELPTTLLPFFFWSIHAVSRFAVVTVIFTHEYVRLDEKSKAKPIAKQKPTKQALLVAAIFGLLPFLFLPVQYVFLIMPILLVSSYLAYYFKKWIGGYTGDCLGATQQIAEWVGYLTVLVIANM